MSYEILLKFHRKCHSIYFLDGFKRNFQYFCVCVWNPYDVILGNFIRMSLQSHKFGFGFGLFFIALSCLVLLHCYGKNTEQLGAGPPWFIEWHQPRLVLLNGTRDTDLSSWEWFTFKYHNNIFSHFYHACYISLYIMCVVFTRMCC